MRDLNRLYRECRRCTRLIASRRASSGWTPTTPTTAFFVPPSVHATAPPVLVVCNFTPVVREGYRVGVPDGGRLAERLNTDAALYGGSNVGNAGDVVADRAVPGTAARPRSTDPAAAGDDHIPARGWLTGTS